MNAAANSTRSASVFFHGVSAHLDTDNRPLHREPSEPVQGAVSNQPSINDVIGTMEEIMSIAPRATKARYFAEHPQATLIDYVLSAPTWTAARRRASEERVTHEPVVREYLSSLYRTQQSERRFLVRAERDAMIAALPESPRGLRDAALLSQRGGETEVIRLTVHTAQRTPEMTAWLEYAGIKEGLALRSLRGQRVQPLGIKRHQVRRIILEAAQAAGISTDRLGGWSLR